MTTENSCKTYSSLEVANTFLKRFPGQLDAMKLQKLVYYAHAWYLALCDEPLVEDRLEAWQYGPVFPQLYAQFKDTGRGVITRKAEVLRTTDSGKVESDTFDVPESDKIASSIIDYVSNTMGGYTGIQLSNLSHRDEEPWSKVSLRKPGVEIPDTLVKQCFKKMVPH